MNVEPDPLRQAASLTTILAGALAVSWALHWLRRRLPLILTRRALDGHATHPSPSFRRGVDLAILPLTLITWLVATWAALQQIETLRAASSATEGAVHMAVTMPLFAVREHTYSLLDVLAIPVLIGLVWVTLGGLTRLLLARVLRSAGVDRGALETFCTLLRFVGTVIGGVVVLDVWGIDVRSLALIASVFSVGIGFGLQHLANNLVSGLVIGLERPVKPGDFVSIGDLQGMVERVGARSVEIVTRDRVSILVPNSHFLEQQVVNWSHRDPTCRLHVPVGVAYGSDVHVVRTALLEAAARQPDVLRDPPAAVAFQGFGDSALLFDLEVWTDDPARQHALASDLNYHIDAAFRRHGVSIPFPQRELRLGSPDLSAILLAFARRHLGDAEVAAAREALRASEKPPIDEQDDLPPDARRSWTAHDVDAVVARMRAPGGLDITDRRYHLNLYRQCFVGRDAVDWLVRREGLTRDEAVCFGTLLVDRRIIHHVLDEHSFHDGDLFYRFLADEPEARTSRDSSPPRSSRLG